MTDLTTARPPLRPYKVCTAKHRQDYGYDCPARATHYDHRGQPVCDAAPEVGDQLVPLAGGTVHNFTDSKCRVRDLTAAREGAECEPCRRALARVRCALCGEQAVVDVIPSAKEQKQKGTRPHSLCQKHYDLTSTLLHRAGMVVPL